MPDTKLKNQTKSATPSSSTLTGRFLWYELMTTDPKAATEFYKGVIGWGTAPFEGAPMQYTFWLKGSTPDSMVGGLMELPTEARAGGTPPHWLAYIGTPDIDSTVERAQELGAQVLLAPEDIPDVGRVAVLKDPQGAAFGLYTPAQEVKPDAEPEKGDFSWNELATTDRVAAFDFYQDLVRWNESTAMDSPAGVYQMYSRQGRDLGGIFTKSPEMPGPMWWFYVLVDDVHGRAEKVKQLGGQVLNGPMEVPGGDWIAQCADPQGALFAIHSKSK